MKKTVAVVYGGRSGEHEVSIRSARSIIDALDRSKYQVREIFINNQGRWDPGPIVPEPAANDGIDIVFPVLHGTFGEDGTVQGLLELAELPYVSPGVLASAVAMDKEVTKRLLRDRDVPIVEYAIVYRGRPWALPVFDFPMFVKPANLGSSVGINKAHNVRELKEAIEAAAEYDYKVIVERSIEGREFECSVMGNSKPVAAIPCEILPSREFYDYDDKYLLDAAKIDLPAKLSTKETEEIQRLAIETYLATSCDVMARVDFLMEDATGKIYVNEINTIPGFTSISMFPKMWEQAGVPYSELLDRLIGFALERAEVRKATRYTK